MLFGVLALALAGPAAADCVKKEAIRLIEGGQPIAGEKIYRWGSDDPCEEFGGLKVHTPKNGIAVFVNVNVEGSIDLDQIDSIFEAQAKPAIKEYARRVELVIVTRAWMKRVKGGDLEAVANMAGDTLFISQKTLENGRFYPILMELYSLDVPKDENSRDQHHPRI